MGTVFDIGNWGLVVWELITFAILLALLYRYVYPPIRDQVVKRQQSIEQAIDEAEQTRAEARRLLEEYRQQISEARSESRQILDEARKQGEAQRERSLKEAREESDRIVARAREEIERERNQSLVEIRKEVADMVIQASEQVVGRSLEREDHERLIQDALSELEEDTRRQQVAR